jgi:DNA polymerase family A
LSLFEEKELPLLDPSTLVPALNPIVVVDGAGLEQVNKYLKGLADNVEPGHVATFVHDYEYNVTEGFYRRRARTLQLGDNNVQYIIDFLAFADGDTRRLIHGQGGFRKSGTILRMYTEDETSFEEAPVNRATFEPIVSVIEPVLDSDAFLKIAHSAEAEYVTSKWCLGIRSWNFSDTLISERIWYNGLPVPKKGFYGLADLVGRHFEVKISKDEQTKFDLHSPLTNEQIIYTALDIRLPWALKPLQDHRIRKAGLVYTAKIENDAVPAFGDMHINGLYVNPDKWQIIINDNEAESKKALDELDSHFIPLVGVKELPDPERVAVAHAAFKACDEATSEEKAISAQILQAQIAKDKELKRQLMEKRKGLQEHRINVVKKQAKDYLKSISYLATKKFSDEVAKMQGQAKINYNSTDQVKEALYDSGLGFNEKNLPDMDAKTTLLGFMHMPIIASYVKLKKIEKLLSSYGYRWITPRDVVAKDTSNKKGFVDPDTGRIHPPFRQLGTDTGRPSCSDPNVLNLPKDGRYRATFEARDGYLNVTKDCSGQELRILTEISREPAWVEAFNNEEDVHSISTNDIRPDLWQSGTVHVATMMEVEDKTGKLVMKEIPPCAFFYSPNGKRLKCKCPEHEKTRTKFKAVNFGIAYDKSGYALAIELGIDVDEAQEILDGWKGKYRITQSALEHLRDSAYEKGEARTLGGRRRILTKVSMAQIIKKAEERWGAPVAKWQIDRMKEQLIAAVKREGGNMPIQGSGADMLKLAMGCGFDPEGQPFLWHVLEPMYGSLLENYLYDEFMAETPEQHCNAVGGPKGVGGAISDAIIRAGTQFVTVVPMASEGAIAKSWTK